MVCSAHQGHAQKERCARLNAGKEINWKTIIVTNTFLDCVKQFRQPIRSLAQLTDTFDACAKPIKGKAEPARSLITILYEREAGPDRQTDDKTDPTGEEGTSN